MSEPAALYSRAPTTVVTSELEQPVIDDRSYRVIKLPNKLEALLVHDKETDKASASLTVNVGSFSDDENLPGQAHAVEHLLFLGTEKYPRENEYSQYLAEHAGYSNAYTTSTHTNYYFEVGHEHLEGALDRFAQFFISPLFLEDCLDRELKAVDSENKKNLQQDDYRFYQLGKSLSNPNFPYSKFSTGSLATLKDGPAAAGINVRDEFIKFHEKYYSANQMKLVVLGRESLDTLQQWTEDLFSAVKNKDLQPPKFVGAPLTEKELLTQIFAKPVTDSRFLEITFPFMDEDELYKAQPSRYISHLIGHEGPGSILAHLKEKGWVIGLSAGANPICSGSSFFVVGIDLTEEGLECYQEIVKAVFQYINLVKETPIQEWVFGELKAMAEVDFRFQQKSPASKFTSKLSPVMLKPLPREYLLSRAVLREFDPAAIRQAMTFLTPDNFRLTVVSKIKVKGVEWDRKEKWYGTEYHVEKVPQQFLEEIRKTVGRNAEKSPALHFPQKNEFIPTKLDVHKKEVKEPVKAPKLIKHTELVRVWYKKDDTFWVPKAYVFISLRNPLIYANPSTSAKARFFCELVKDALNEYTYDAEIAGLDYGLKAPSIGLELEIGGYNEKIPALLEKVLLKMRDLEIKPDRFKMVKDWMTRAYKNWDFSPPYRQIREFTRYLTMEKMWLYEEYLEEMEQLSLEDVKAFIPQLFSKVHIEILAHGNIYKEDALKLSHQVEDILKPRVLPHSQFNSRRSLILPPEGRYIYSRLLKDPDNVNSCTEYYLFVGEVTDRRLRALLNVFAQMTDEPSFDQLRTKEQLGYIVFSGPHMAPTTMGYRVLIQSERSAAYLESRIEKFLDDYKNVLDKVTDRDFQNHINSLIKKKTEKVKNLLEESEKYWTYIGNEFYDFYQLDEEVSILRTIKKAEVVDFYMKYIHPSSPRRSKLSIHLMADKSSIKDASSKLPLTLAQQKQVLFQTLTQYLNLEAPGQLQSQPEILTQRFLDVDITKRESIVDAVKRYLQEDENLEDDVVARIVQKGEVLLTQLLPQLGPMESDKEGADKEEESRILKKNVIIEDPVAWKAGLMLSKAAAPVRPLTDFEETNLKL